MNGLIIYSFIKVLNYWKWSTVFKIASDSNINQTPCCLKLLRNFKKAEKIAFKEYWKYVVVFNTALGQIEFGHSEKATKFETISHLIRRKCKSQIRWKIISNIVAFFKNLNFTIAEGALAWVKFENYLF